MGDMQVGTANIDDKGFTGLMENKPVKSVVSSNPSLEVSVSFGRFENDSLSWEKFSAFSPNKYLEEVGKCATPGSVAQKKAYFEAHYKKIAERKAEIMDREKQMDKNTTFRSTVSDHGSIIEGQNSGLVTESEVDEGSNGEFTCEEDKHVTDIAIEVDELSNDKLNEETIIVKECQTSVDQVKEEVNDTLESHKQEISLVEEETEVRDEVREETSSKDGIEDTKEMSMKEVKIEKKHNLIKKNVGNARINPTKASPKPNQMTKKLITNKIVTSTKTPPSKELRHLMKSTKKPAASVSKSPPGLSTPKVSKQPHSQNSSVEKDNVSILLRNKQTGPKSLHISMSLGPSASDPTALTSTRKSLIMERMGDKDIVKRAFKTFQKSFDFNASVDRQTTALKQNPAKATSIPSIASRQKENGRPTKASSMEKRSGTSAHRSPSHGHKIKETTEKQQKELSKSGARPVEKTRLQKNKKVGVVDAKTRRDSLYPKAKLMQGSIPVRTLPKVSSDKVL